MRPQDDDLQKDGSALDFGPPGRRGGVVGRVATDTIERSPGGTQRTLDAALLTFDIPALLTEMKRERAWQTGDRTAMTLLKTRELRLVLVAMHAGTAVPEHRAEGAVAVHVVQGRVLLHSRVGDVTLDAGQLLTLQPGIWHGVRAIDDCAYLLAMAAVAAHPVEPPEDDPAARAR